VPALQKEMDMNKFTLALAGAAAMVMSSAANAALVTTSTNITPSTPSDSFNGVPLNCSSPPCTFQSIFTFTTPTNFNALNLSVNSIAGDLNSTTDINFTNLIFNNGTSNSGSLSITNGLNDLASLVNINLIAGATNTLTVFSSGANSGIPIDANFGLTLAFRNVAPVPEPGTWAMMLLGFAGMGAAMRRSRKPLVTQLA
jgi:hypothetical protein